MLATGQTVLEFHMHQEKQQRKHTVLGNVSWILSSFSAKIEVLPPPPRFSSLMGDENYTEYLAT